MVSNAPVYIIILTLLLILVVPLVSVLIIGLILSLALGKNKKYFHLLLSTVIIWIYISYNSIILFPDYINIIISIFIVFTFFKINKIFNGIIFTFTYIYIALLILWIGIFTPINGLIFSNINKHSEKNNNRSKIPVTIVVFDEMSNSGLLDDKGRIDKARFPNFYQLSKDGILFTNALSNSESTRTSIPTILTGKHVDAQDSRLPISNNYPGNLLVAASKYFSVNSFEPASNLCPNSICKESVPFNFKVYLQDIFYVIIQNTPLKKLFNNTPVTEGRWNNFKGNSSFISNSGIHEGVFFEKLLMKFEAKDKSQFNFIHISRPHIPYERLPDGRTYDNNLGIFPAGIISDFDGWMGDEELIKIAYHRYLLQLGYVDKILGVIINKMKDANIYDDGILILTADHGIAFKLNESRRSSLVSNNIKEIHNVPLIIKPNKDSIYYKAGGLVPEIVSHIDIVPTLSHLLGLELIPNVDGISVFSDIRNAERVTPIDGGRSISKINDITGFDRLSWKLKNFSCCSDLMELTREDGLNKVFNGVNISQFDLKNDENKITVNIKKYLLENLNISNNSLFSPLRVYGNIDGPGFLNDKNLVLSLNGVIRGVAKTTFWGGVNGYFEIILPPAFILDGSNDIDFYIINDNSIYLNSVNINPID